MNYLTIDGMLSGTGIRHSVDGGFLNPCELGISVEVIEKISRWLKEYEDAHYQHYVDKPHVEKLDSEGIEICRMLREALSGSKVEYYSSAEARRLII